MGKKASRPPASKTSSAASPAVSGLTHTGNKSSILRSAFSPSEYQLALFASVIQGLDGQHLRIHDTITGRLQCEHVLGSKEVITSLDWGYYPGRQGGQQQQSKKKRKRNSDVNGLEQGDVVVAFGTSTSDIRMYSPTEDKIVGTLAGVHEKGIKDFKFTANQPGQEGWSIGGDNKLVQWDLRTGQSTRIINLPASSTFTSLSRPSSSNTPVVCASQTPYIINTESADQAPISFPAMRNPIQTLISASTESAVAGAFLASDNDRYINVFDPQSQKIVMNLVADKEVASLSFHAGPGEKAGDAPTLEKQILAAVTDDGTIEIFTKPFFQQAQKTNSLKAKGRQMTRRADASIKITKSEGSEALVTVVTTSFQGPDLVVACAEGGVIPVFERIRLLNEDTEELSFTGLKKVAKTKSSSALGTVTTNGGKNAGESHVDESRAVVEQGNMADDDIEMQDTTQDAASNADSEEDSDDDQAPKKTNNKKESRKTNEAESDVEMDNAQGSGPEDEEDEEETGEPSFGELMRANAAEEIDVEAELEDDVRMGPYVPSKPKTAVQQIPTGVSLSTVLSQSLKTNDNDMLESCFHTGDLSIIRNTIQRLDSSLAATLLQKLAERLSSRPGRYGHLLVWVQWTCVAHGGALAGKPDLLKRMATLFKVMDQRSSSLPSLLLLKGKLDMLDAQLGLRQSIRSGAEGMDSEDEDNVIYVEGHEDDDDEDSDADTKAAATPRKSIRDQAFDEDESMMNGVDESDNDEDDGSEEEEDENADVFDVEAEESAGSSDAEESLEENEDDDEDAESTGSMVDFIADTEDEASEDEGASAPQPPPSKKVKVGGGKGKNKAGRR
ncbi:hypothetical protein ASPWEDRAFT_22835 [Aspergillus wentii DTO 134E9]|uniref:Small-subunit processome Utp12 domain-containing protein n=1 Tax=Aspergillus wentii DTO 134E9 TaxID=1073089 RepID=A0A1L9S0J7_ASPWE|nr:uncharacterized protein ASPWEDRAFT_22835 [Aspergillus wentii DTO 134E9]KAI9931311.1 Small subunit (SSU) processome component [Aspergillus wentii]OJJ40671.1 hypothetical protein ASPWEDRAFT_22835 [Aspergillus wentii DTO 134E9]